MKEYFFKSIAVTAILLVLLLNQQTSYSQAQTIGSFPNMDGGFENQASSGAAAVLQSTPSSYYTVSNSNSIVSFINGGARTGNKYISWTVSGNSSNAFYTPSDLNGGVVNNTSYTVQYYYKNSSTSNSKYFLIAMSPDGINAFGSSATPQTGNTMTQTNWTKGYTTVVSGTSSQSQSGTIRFNPNSTFSGAYFYIDDIVAYAGGVDTEAPSAVTGQSVNASTSSSLSLQWTAANTDGGGYMIVRYTSDPASSVAPNVNGIYGVGNTIGNGTVVYLGTNASFVDNGLNLNSTYYYRVYTVDKAFNYSSPVVLNSTTSNSSSLDELTVSGKTLLATLGNNVGIGTTTPTQKLDVNGNIRASRLFVGNITDAKVSSISNDIQNNYLLSVNGTALFNKIKVKSSSAWPDYVFEDRYPLLPLNTLEKYIKLHKHLPELASACEVENDGIDLGEIQTTLVQKIEELTLYAIDQNKRTEALQKQNELLQFQIDELKKLLTQKNIN